MKSFLSFVGYYPRFYPDFRTVVRPLNILSCKQTQLHWGVKEEGAFQRLKHLLMKARILTYSHPSKQYLLDTNEAAGAVLSQVVERGEKLVACSSNTSNPPQRNYCVIQRELLAVVTAVNHFRPSMYG